MNRMIELDLKEIKTYTSELLTNTGKIEGIQVEGQILALWPKLQGLATHVKENFESSLNSKIISTFTKLDLAMGAFIEQSESIRAISHEILTLKRSLTLPII